MNTTREDMVLAIMEGVAFAIRDSFGEVRNTGIKIERSKI